MINKEKPKKRFSCLIVLLVAFVVLVIAGIGAYLYFKNWYNTAISKANPAGNSIISFEIPTGTSAAEIGKILKDLKLIDEELAWQIYIKLNQPELLADNYEIPQNFSIVQIVEILKAGQEDKVVWITIPEGLRMDEIETIIASKMAAIPGTTYDKALFNSLITKPDAFLDETKSAAGSYIKSVKPDGKSLEGFLFPDTYAIRLDADTETVLTTLLENFMKKTKGITPQNGLSFYENLIIASIVEREAAPADHAGVASVFIKRIETNDKLGSDITVLYILKRWRPEPTAKELLIESPYNTRKNYGIPPTPICNPGLSAIAATEVAQAGKNVFFLADEYGKIHYGTNLSEHNYNICKYLTKTCK